MKAIVLLLLFCAACGGGAGDETVNLEDLTLAEAAALGIVCEDLDRDDFCDVAIALTVTWPEGWR